MDRPRVLLTRPEARARALANDLVHDGIDAAIWPLLTIRPLLTAAPDWSGAQAILLTSANGAEAIAPFGAPDLPAICVGRATAEAARRAGFRGVEDAGAHGEGDAAGLAAHVIATRVAAEGGLIHVRGRKAAGDIPVVLAEAGFKVGTVIAYEAEAATETPETVASDIAAGDFSVVAFFSPRTSAIFAHLARSEWREGLGAATAVAISDAAAKPLAGVGFRAIEVAARPEGAAMRAAICGAAKNWPGRGSGYRLG